MGFIIIALFFLLPLFSAVIIFSISRKMKWLTYLITLILGVIYPLLFIHINQIFNPPPVGPRCATGEAGLVFGGWIIGVPILLLLQMIVNSFYQQKEIARASPD